MSRGAFLAVQQLETGSGRSTKGARNRGRLENVVLQQNVVVQQLEQF
jgi:hypothetical protein